MLFILRQTLVWVMFFSCTAGLLLTFAEIAFSSTDIKASADEIATAEQAVVWLEGKPELSSWLKKEGLDKRVLEKTKIRPELIRDVAQVRDHVNLRNSDKLINVLLAIEVARSSRQPNN